MSISSRKRVWLTGGSIVGLAAGFAIGMTLHGGQPSGGVLTSVLTPIGALWINALRMTVVPLVAAQLVATIVAMRGPSGVGRIGGITVFTFVVMLIALGALGLLVIPAILAYLPRPVDVVAAFGPAPAPPPTASGSPVTFGTWLVGLVPANPLRAATQDDLLGVMIFAIAFGLAIRGMTLERRVTIGDISRIVADAMMTIIGWVLWLMPIAAFALALSTSRANGLRSAGLVVVFVVSLCALLLFCTLLLYPIGALSAGISLRRFAAAVLPAQLVAVATRSSIASLPSMMECARRGLGARAEVSSLVLPLAVSSFKLNRMLTNPFQFLFLAHMYGVELSVPQIGTFVLASLVLSFSTIGIPSGGSLMRSMPLYVAAGIPLEGYLLLEAVDAIPDVLKTLMNVTGDLTSVAIVNRFSPTAAPVATSAPAVEGVAAGV